MKLTYAQLEAHLAKQLAPLYIVSGDELILKQDVVHLIRKAAKKYDFSERLRITPDTDGEQLYAALYSTSLLAEKRLIELDYRDSVPNKNAGKILQEYAAHPSPDTVLLIDISKIDDKISKSAWYKALEKSAISIPVWPVPREQLSQWIQQRAKKYKLQFHPLAANLLADYVEGNLIAAAQTLEKIYLLRPQEIITIDLIQSILTDESHFTVFDFIDSLIAGDMSRAFHILNILKIEGTEPVFILWGITRELRLLAEFAQQLQHGQTYEQLFQKQRIFLRRQASIRRFLNKFNAADCWHHLTHASEIDSIIKGAREGNVWDSLQTFCLRLA